MKKIKCTIISNKSETTKKFTLERLKKELDKK